MFDVKFDDIRVGDKLVSKGRTITEADLIFFSMMTQDWSDIHIDREYVAKTVFKERIAHAGLTMAVVCGLLQPVVDSSLSGIYGMNEIRFVAPTMLGDTIHAELEVTAKEARGDGRGVVEMRLEVKNHRGQLLVLTAIKAALLG